MDGPDGQTMFNGWIDPIVFFREGWEGTAVVPKGKVRQGKTGREGGKERRWVGLKPTFSSDYVFWGVAAPGWLHQARPHLALTPGSPRLDGLL